MREWTQTTIGAQATLQRGVDITKLTQRSGAIPVISSGGIFSFHDTPSASGPGVILGRKGVVGSVYYVEEDYWPHDTTLWVRDFHGNQPRFVYYFFRWLAPRLASMDVGSANPTLNRNHVHPIAVAWPNSLAVQHSISSLLGALDDKIDLNRRMNETLEAMARAIFNDWFVHFGPTRAKMEGRPPYLAPDLWALFPDRLDDEGKPEGWKISSIGSEVKVLGGSTPSTTNSAYWDGTISWATPKDLSRLSSPVLTHTERQITEQGLTQIGSGLLPSGTLLLSSRAPIGYLAISQVPVAVNQGFIAMVCDGRLSNVFCWLWSFSKIEEIKQRANGSTFLEISKSNFRPIPVIMPSDDLLRAFDRMVGPLHSRLAQNVHESRTLESTRDLLLPKLMSGEVQVRDAENLLGAAA